MTTATTSKVAETVITCVECDKVYDGANMSEMLCCGAYACSAHCCACPIGDPEMEAELAAMEAEELAAA